MIFIGGTIMDINTTKKPKIDKMLLRNNERKMAGLPLHRKKISIVDVGQDVKQRKQ